MHRDVKPGNILRADEGTVKLADFGIAKAIGSSSITQVGSVLGTAAYLAPEQAHGEPATPQSDIYGLGVVLYQLLAGRLPYEATTLSELVLLQQSQPPARLDAVNPDVAPAVAAVIDRALALEPEDREDRYDSAEDFRAALENGERGVETATSATRVESLPRPPQQPSRPAPSLEPTRRSSNGSRSHPQQPRNQAAIAPPAPAAAPRGARRRGRGARWVLPLLLLAIGIGGAAWVTQSGDDVRLRKVVYDNVDRTVGELQQLIRQNTR